MVSGGKCHFTGESKVFTGDHNPFSGENKKFIGERVTNIKTRTVKHLRFTNYV
ncbi:hypothetical protein [Fictibacillus phosphorivorans]|uniref:hypothetical protein n=1 Tax=Fictibacillus phosphorivorans TaxID=1221500 RepID=UPI0012931E09|nr:hypothetical protein [Fictibacillus phosphorivorans]